MLTNLKKERINRNRIGIGIGECTEQQYGSVWEGKQLNSDCTDRVSVQLRLIESINEEGSEKSEREKRIGRISGRGFVLCCAVQCAFSDSVI